MSTVPAVALLLFLIWILCLAKVALPCSRQKLPTPLSPPSTSPHRQDHNQNRREHDPPCGHAEASLEGGAMGRAAAAASAAAAAAARPARHPIELLLESQGSILQLRGASEEGDGKIACRRGLYTSRACPAGELLHTEDAYAFSPLTADGIHASRSHHTLRESTGLRRCSGCRFALYATETEQREAWDGGHRDECAGIRFGICVVTHCLALVGGWPSSTRQPR